ncbi:MAG: hypothetical protein R3F59_31020 [Myxococcota bacterium]
MFTSDPVTNALVVAAYAALVVVGLGGSVGLCAVAAVQVRHRFGSAWLWLLAAGAMSAVTVLASLVGSWALGQLGGRLGFDTMLRVQLAMSLADSGLRAVWWVLLLGGVVAMVRHRA